MSSLTLMLAAAFTPPRVAEIFNSGVGMGKVLLIIAVGQILAVVANWLGSILFAGERASFGRAVLLYLASLGLIIVASVVLALGVPMLMKARGTPGALLFGGGVGLLFLTLLIVVPMKLYQVGFLRALGVIASSAFISFLLGAVLQLAVVGDETLVKSDAVREWAAQSMPKTPVDRDAQAEELRQRQAELAKRYELLTIRHKHMSSDPASISAYFREKEAYERDIARFREDAAAFESVGTE